MSYSADTFVADEQPTTAKWNKLWSNDAAFNDGTGIASGAITSAKISGIDKSLLTTDSNPYKFDVYRHAAYTTVSAATTVLPYDTEAVDTNNNFAASTYTAPVAGFYIFFANIATSAVVRLAIDLRVNGANRIHGSDPNASALGSNVGGLVQLAASDTVDITYFTGSAVAMTVDTTRFSGFLYCRT